jgi:hypothetical protein
MFAYRTTLQRNACLMALGFATFLVVMSPRPATALTQVTACGTTCTTDCELAQNITCAAGQDGVILTNGADLHLHTFNISCSASSPDGCNNAVTASAGSQVDSDAAQGGGVGSIVGRWFRGIDCQSNASTRIVGVTLRGYWSDSPLGGAIYACQFVDSNVINSQPDEGTLLFDPTFPVWSRNCIVHKSITTQDFIAGNHIDGCNRGIVRISGTLNLAIAGNSINCRDISPPLTFNLGHCIDLGTTTRPTTVIDNVLTGDTRGFVINGPASGATYNNNICKFGMKNCSLCVSQGRCAANGTSTSP